MLLLCATPIGNLGDITLRVRDALFSCDAIYCEDTRHTRILLNHLGVKKPLFSCHQHNEAARAEELSRRLAAGENIVYVSDAGMPGISDPGALLVNMCIEKDLPYTVLPGASAVTTAAVLCGLPAQPFTFYGFFPREKKEQKRVLGELETLGHLALFYESPNRVAATFQTLFDALGERDAALVRELTKVHEAVRRGTLSALADAYAAEPPRGECVIAVLCEKKERVPLAENARVAYLAALLEAGLSVKDASARAASEYGIPKKEAYALCLQQKSRA